MHQNPQWYLGGDSAGTQIAAQYAAAQTNSTYRAPLQLAPLPQHIRLAGTILYCGPYNFKRIHAEAKASNNWANRWFIHTVGWAMTGKFFWDQSALVHEATVARYVTAHFPASYITDGTRYTFPSSGKELVRALKRHHVSVTSRFFPKKVAVNHEYQFEFNTPKALTTFRQTLHFLTVH